MELNKQEMTLLRDSFWRERVAGVRELTEEKIRKRMEYLGLDLPGPQYCVVLFAPYLLEKDPIEIDQTLIELLREVQAGYKKAGFLGYVILDSYCNIVSILSLQAQAAYWELNDVTVKLTSRLITEKNIEMYVGIGDTVNRLVQLNQSKDTASYALNQKFSVSENYVISARDIMSYYDHKNVDLKVHYDRVIGCLYDGNTSLMSVRLHELLYLAGQTSPNDIGRIHNVCIELVATLKRVVRDLGVISEPEIESAYTRIVQIDNVPELYEWTIGYICVLVQKVNEARQDKTQQLVAIADAYIEENICNPDLTVQSISDYVALSAAYFSGIFFKTKGVHLNEYINRLRVRNAQQLLLESQEKVSDIATKLGFSSASYFNSVFKKFTGVSPTRYRENGIQRKSRLTDENAIYDTL